MIKDIVTDTELLSTPCEKATIEDAAVVEDLMDTLAANENSACLAANQIGVTKRIAVYLDDNDQVRNIFNPSIRKALYANKVTEECLSLEGEVNVRRFGWIEVECEELVDGKLVKRKRSFQDWQAQIIQHMIDHCNGKLV